MRKITAEGVFRIIILGFTYIAVPESTHAAEPARVAVSDKLGLVVFANPDASGNWCHPTLSLSISLKSGSPLLAQGITDILPRVGSSLGEKCHIATAAKIAVYNDGDRSLVGTPFTVTKADNWQPAPGNTTPANTSSAPTASGSPSPTGLASPPSPAAPPPPTPKTNCEHSVASTDYFVSACVVRGLEYRHLVDALPDAKARYEAASHSLACTPDSLSVVYDLAQQSASRIIASNAISALMDFNSALNVECKKAATEALQ